MEKLNINVNGNKKLRNTDKVRFMIWNLPAVKTCPFRTEMCEKSCYARKAERVYPSVLPSRERNYNDSLQADFVDRMIYTIEKELATKKYKGKLTVFRIHESGDFYNLEYTEKWVRIAEYFENNPNIVFLAYTKSIIYFLTAGLHIPNNLIVRASIWKDTDIKLTELSNKYFPIYTALTAEDMETERKNGHKFTVCECSDCANCCYCWNKSEKDIICKIH